MAYRNQSYCHQTWPTETNHIVIKSNQIAQLDQFNFICNKWQDTFGPNNFSYEREFRNIQDSEKTAYAAYTMTKEVGMDSKPSVPQNVCGISKSNFFSMTDRQQTK